jgi:hypothetical protein
VFENKFSLTHFATPISDKGGVFAGISSVRTNSLEDGLFTSTTFEFDGIIINIHHS